MGRFQFYNKRLYYIYAKVRYISVAGQFVCVMRFYLLLTVCFVSNRRQANTVCFLSYTDYG